MFDINYLSCDEPIVLTFLKLFHAQTFLNFNVFFFTDDNQDKLSDSSPGSVGAAVDAAAEELSKMTPEEVERQRAEWSQVCIYIKMTEKPL